MSTKVPTERETEKAPAATALGTYGDSLTPPPAERQNRRSSRHSLKAAQRRLTSAISSRLCWYSTGEDVSIDLGSSLTAHTTGIARCGSSWSCPVCAPVIRERRAAEVDQGLRTHLDQGGGALFLTLTVRHHQGDRLGPRLDAVAQSLRLCLRGSGWERRRDRFGYVGSIKAVEITHGRHGWHPHSHSVLLFDRPLTDLEVEDLRSWLHGRWSKAAHDRGFGWVHPTHGVDLRSVTDGDGIGRYVTKVEGGWTAGHELTRSDRKINSPLQLLVGFVETGETRLRDLWQEYEQATHGHHSIGWSRGLRSRLGLDDDQADVELAAGEGADLTLMRAILDSSRWNRVTKAGATGALLTTVEEVGSLLLHLVHVTGGNPQPLDVPQSDQDFRSPEAEQGRRPSAGGDPPEGG